MFRMSLFKSALMLTVLLLIQAAASVSSAQTLMQTIKHVKPAVVGVGSYLSTRRPPSQYLGTGFVVGDGYHVITNHYIVDKSRKNKEQLGIFYRVNKQVKFRKARILAKDKTHDLVLLRIEGTKLPVIKIESSRTVSEGEEIAFTGLPIGAVLGLYPVTHRGIVSAISPVVIPAPSSSTLSVKMIKRLRNPYWVYQLDATVYPSNSGSPM